MCMFAHEMCICWLSDAVGSAGCGASPREPFDVVRTCVPALAASRWTGGDKSIPN